MSPKQFSRLLDWKVICCDKDLKKMIKKVFKIDVNTKCGCNG